jgi:hypothetical protein
MRLVLASLLCCLACQQPLPERDTTPVREDSTFLTGTFYLARHVDTTLLYHYLKDSDINKIYIPTNDSITISLKIDTVHYEADFTGEGLIYELIKHEDWGKHVLIVGQNYSLMPAVHSLKAKTDIDEIKDNELLVVRKFKDSVTCKVQKYQ